jgi:hypothetical protein
MREGARRRRVGKGCASARRVWEDGDLDSFFFDFSCGVDEVPCFQVSNPCGADFAIGGKVPMAGASGFLLGDDAVEFMRERGEQTWEAANEAGGCTAGWTDDCAQCGDDGGLRACCGYCHLVFHPACLDPPQDVENWDEVAFACGLCVTDAKAKPANTQGARLKRQMRQQRATTAAAEARRAARNKDIRDEHDAIALFVEQRAGGAAAAKEELWRPQRHPTASSEEGRYTPRSRSHGQIPNTVPTIHLCQHPRCTVQPW